MENAQAKINEYVNRAQLAINDWQCSGDIDYLAMANTNMTAAVDLAKQQAAGKEPPEKKYYVTAIANLERIIREKEGEADGQSGT